MTDACIITLLNTRVCERGSKGCQTVHGTELCGAYLGDNDGTCPQLTCIRRRRHDGLCDNVRGDG